LPILRSRTVLRIALCCVRCKMSPLDATQVDLTLGAVRARCGMKAFAQISSRCFAYCLRTLPTSRQFHPQAFSALAYIPVLMLLIAAEKLAFGSRRK
jgi:uncharacterized membrane protein